MVTFEKMEKKVENLNYYNKSTQNRIEEFLKKEFNATDDERKAKLYCETLKYIQTLKQGNDTLYKMLNDSWKHNKRLGTLLCNNKQSSEKRIAELENLIDSFLAQKN